MVRRGVAGGIGNVADLAARATTEVADSQSFLDRPVMGQLSKEDIRLAKNGGVVSGSLFAIECVRACAIRAVVEVYVYGGRSVGLADRPSRLC